MDRLLKWNEKRDRADHETGDGGKMQRFFKGVRSAFYPGTDADQVENHGARESENGSVDNISTTDPFCIIEYQDDNPNVSKLVALHGIDPNDYLEGVPVVTFRDWTDALFAGRRNIIES